MLSTARHAPKNAPSDHDRVQTKAASKNSSVTTRTDCRHIRGLPPMSTSHVSVGSVSDGQNRFHRRTALGKLSSEDILLGIQRHLSGDWGDVTSTTANVNNHALEGGSRLFSVYHFGNRREILDYHRHRSFGEHSPPSRGLLTLSLLQSGGGFFSPQIKKGTS